MSTDILEGEGMAKTTEPVSIDGITFDAWIDSEEAWDADAPVYPVETGFEVSDTVILHAKRLSMTLFLTNTPVTFLDRHGAGKDRVQDVLARLRQAYLEKKPVTVTTPDSDYENMAIIGIVLPKKIETGSSKEIPVTFMQIRTVEAGTVAIPANLGRGGASGTNAGTANTNSAPAPENVQSEGGRGSILHNLAGAAGLFGR